jgi:hypothetical protein
MPQTPRVQSSGPTPDWLPQHSRLPNDEARRSIARARRSRPALSVASRCAPLVNGHAQYPPLS